MGNILPWGAKASGQRRIEQKQIKRTEGFDYFHQRCRSLENERREYILAMGYEELRQGLQNDSLSPTEVHQAYGWKILEINDKINCVAEMITGSFTMAAEVERLYRNKPNKPAFYGIPVSVKGNFFMPGYDCTIGFSKFIGMPKDSQCSLVSTLIELGAIPICLTNVPQALLSYACSNPVYGTTENPLAHGMTPGGSSGGEAALVAAGGIPFGTGSDVAGSLRIPAVMCGIVSIKPSEARLLITNSHGGFPGKCRLGLSFGFFTHNVGELINIFDLYLNSEEHLKCSPRSIPMPFDMSKVHKKEKLRIGYFSDIGFLPPVPAAKRALRHTVKMLEVDGHELIPFDIPHPQLMAELVMKNILPDGGAYMKDLFSGDIVDDYMTQFLMLLKIPDSIRKIASYAIQYVSPQLATMCRIGMNSIPQLRYMQEQTDDYAREWYEQWNELNLDAMVCPSFPVTQLPHSYPSKLGACAVYTGLFNMLDCPAGIVPVDKISEQDIKDLNNDNIFRVGLNPILKDMRSGCSKDEGLPVSVQVVTLPYREELCLHVMQIIESLAAKHH
uniref:Amidase domain-containing protein n=1 Tax=Panagrolaimus sp. ES5 TaxID=591445 RepID=A0AC34FHR4_9BILA